MATYKQNPDGSLTKTLANGKSFVVSQNDDRFNRIANEAVGAGGSIKGPIVAKPMAQTPPIAAKQTPDQYIKDLQQAQTQASLAGLDKARNQALSNLQSERSNIQPKFYEAKRQQIGQSQTGARNFAEYLASQGLNSSGLAGQGELMRQGALQGQIGALNQQETQAYTDIGRRTSDVENAYLSDAEAARAGNQAQMLQNLISQFNTDRDFGFRQDQFDYGRSRDTIADQRYDDEMAWSRSAENPAVRSQLLANQIAELELKNLPEFQRLQLQQLKKEIANIGRSSGGGGGRSPAQIEMDNIKLEKAKLDLEKLRNPSNNNTEKAIELAIKDPDYLNATSPEEKEEIVNYYRGLLGGSSGGMTDEELLKYFK